jgi:transcriptional regulator with XRE-family HTH domain
MSYRARHIRRVIRDERHALGMTQHGLADEAGIGRQTLAQIEQGKCDPTLETLAKIIDALTLSWLDFWEIVERHEDGR